MAGPLRRYTLPMVVLLLALCVRLALILSSGLMIDGDEALVGLQALHIVQNGERPIFFYGQAYMGSLEAYLAAALFALTGGPSALALRTVGLAFATGLVYTTYCLARRLWEPPAAALAALFAACPALYVAVWTVKARGGFVETLFFGALLLLLTASLCGPERRAGYGRWLAVGLIAGLAFWVSGMIAYYLLAITPFLLWTVWRAPRWGLRGLLVATVGAVAGAAPLLLYNLRHGWVTVAFLFGGAAAGSGQTLRQLPAVLGYFVRACLPELTGAWQPYTVSSGVVGAAVLAFYALGFATLIGDAARRRMPLLFLLIVQALCVPLVFATSGFGGPSLNPYGFDATGRYTLPLAALLPLLATALVRGAWLSRARWGRPVAVALALLMLSNTLIGYAAADKGLIFQSEYWHRLPLNGAPLIGCLDHLGVHDLWMNHWAGYPLMFATRERFVAADYNDVVLNGGVNRLPWTLREVGHAARPAYVLVAGSAAQTPLERRLRELNVRYHRCVAVPYQVLQPISRRVDPRDVAATLGYSY